MIEKLNNHWHYGPRARLYILLIKNHFEQNAICGQKFSQVIMVGAECFINFKKITDRTLKQEWRGYLRSGHTNLICAPERLDRQHQDHRNYGGNIECQVPFKSLSRKDANRKRFFFMFGDLQ